MTTPFIVDTIGAFVPHGRFVLEGAPSGPLAGLTFAAKDLFHVAGHPTGAGNPTWLATHAVPVSTSPLITTLLDAGATLVGKTLTDELAYSINGDNAHYGTPVNVRAPGRVPGGSSSGSVAAVAAGLCDFALGTDTGGSTRVPASYCGVWGLRTTHGLLPVTSMVPLNPGFDTPTWFADHPATFARVARVLLPPAATVFRRAMLFEDLLGQADGAFHGRLEAVFSALGRQMDARRASVTPGGTADELESWRQTYVTASAREAWQVHGEWIEACRPVFGTAVAGRFDIARGISDAAAEAAHARKEQIRAHVRALLGDDGIAVIPSAAGVAPLLTASGAQIDELRSRTFRITCVAGLAGLPQVSLPFLSPDGLPVGVSLLGPAGSDRALVEFAVALATQMRESEARFPYLYAAL